MYGDNYLMVGIHLIFTVLLVLVVAPSTPIINFEPQVAEIDQTLVLTCTAEGGPNNTLQWYKDGTLLMGARSGLSIDTDDAYPTSIRSNLTIASLATDDLGNYTCTVSNAAGTASYTALLAGKCRKLTVNDAEHLAFAKAVILIILSCKIIPVARFGSKRPHFRPHQ